MPNTNGQTQTIKINFHAWHDAVTLALKPVRDQILKPLTDAGHKAFNYHNVPNEGWGAFWHFEREGGTAYLQIVHISRERRFEGCKSDKPMLAEYSALLEAAGIKHQVYDAGQPIPVYMETDKYPSIVIPAVEVPPMPDLTIKVRATVVGIEG